MAPVRFNECFDQIYVVNLPDRRDRREYVERQLESVGLLRAPNLAFFPAIRPAEAEGFPNAGAHGCFLSHLAIMQQAVRTDAKNLLVFEDDATFAPCFSQVEDSLVAQIKQGDWDILYFGHEGVPLKPSRGLRVERFDGPIVTLVAYALSGRVTRLLVPYLEAVLSRSPGDPRGGPMHVDGALTMFRAEHPELITRVCLPRVVAQASFRSDISPGMLDRTPGLRSVVGWLRRVRRAMLQQAF